ncbi:MAG: methionyl-tRNA formyltransferase [Spirochaetaceae bacterium]|nr:MAG: methionyl-tRNA formyltransferase [Spirochaetaceae bacterium]
MRILFAGTPDIAVPALQQLHEQFEVTGVLTAPDAASGRSRALQPPPVKRCAVELGLTVLQPQRLDGDARRRVAAGAPQVLACVAFGKIFGPRFLQLFPFGGVNVHPSLLPRHRGPSPIPAAILAGDRETGITVQQLAPEMDSGDILRQIRFPLDGSETSATLGDRAAVEGALLLAETLHDMQRGTLEPRPQDHSQATYCSLIAPHDAEIDWHLPLEQIERMVRAYNPWPGAYTLLDGTRLTIHEARPLRDESSDHVAGTVVAVDKRCGILVQTGSGLLAVRRLQLQSRNAIDWKSFANGYRNIIGAVLGGSPHS